MSMSGKNCFQTAIRDYDSFRAYLRFVYIYGCCTKEFMTDNGLTTSARKFEEDTRRTRAIIPEYIDETTTSRKKALRVNTGALEAEVNFLSISYFIRTFTDYDFALYFSVLLLLVQTPGLGFTELLEKVIALTGFYEMSDKTLQRFLKNELANKGIIDDRGGYSLFLDRLASLCDEEIESLLVVVDFYKNTLPANILGEYAHDTLLHYARFERSIIPSTSLFLFRYRHMERIVDDNALLPLIACVRDRRKARYTYKEKKREGFPRQIRFDPLYGRQYAVIHDGNRWHNALIANIRDVEELLETTTAEFGCFLSDSWFAAYSDDENKPRSAVRVRFYISYNERHILKRLNREKRHGTVTTVRDGEYLFDIQLSNPLEILPWLRSFLGFASVEKSDEHDLFEQYAAFLTKMRELYGV